jgi:Flp pilus assembly protein protease CpaA
MSVLLCITSLVIIFRDLRSHIISNHSLVFLAIPLAFLYEGSSISHSFLASLILILVAIATSIGGGDIKLIFLLIWSSPHLFFSLRYWTIFLAVSLALLIAARMRAGWQEAQIPMAPAILLPLMASNLGI